MHSTNGWLAVTFTVLVLLPGCGRSPDSDETTTDKTAADTAAVAPTTPAPGTSAPAWAVELRQGEKQLGQAVEQGRLGEVHDQALELQGLLTRVAGEAGNLAPEQRQQLTEHLAAAEGVVGELHEAGDAGDLTKAKAKFREFQTHLRAVESVFGVAAP